MKPISYSYLLRYRFFSSLSLSKERTKASFICPHEYKSKFSQARALLPVSVGMAVHEKSKFDATMEAVQKNFNSCVIIVDDTIQRFTMSIYYPGKSSRELIIDSSTAGSEWIKRNKPTLDRLTIPYRIIRWSYWLHHMEFQNAMDQVKEMNKNNPLFQIALDTSIEEFLSRVGKRIKFDKPSAVSACRKYLFEECAAMTLWPELRCQFEIYPSGRNMILKTNYELLIEPKYPDLLKSVAVRFNKKNVDHIIVDPADLEEKQSAENRDSNSVSSPYFGF